MLQLLPLLWRVLLPDVVVLWKLQRVQAVLVGTGPAVLAGEPHPADVLPADGMLRASRHPHQAWCAGRRTP